MTDRTLSDLIAACIERKQGDKEFRLSYCAEATYGPWEAEIGNPNTSVMLGEVAGEFFACGGTAEAACAALLTKLEAQ